MELKDYIEKINGPDEDAALKAHELTLEHLSIPGSLGRLEDMAAKLAGVTGKVKNSFAKKCIIIMSADNGIVAQGVSSAPQEVTVQMTECFSRMVTGVGVVSLAAGNDLIVYDVGINGDIRDPLVINKKIRRGTSDMSQGPAMTREECEKAIMIGIEAVGDAIAKGYDCFGAGEMGIGNTSTSSCIVSVLTGTPIEEVTGAGTGVLTDDGKNRKAEILRQAIEVNKPDASDVLDVMSKVGGFEIAAMTGIYIGCAYHRVPVVIDGFISSVAALCAYKLNPLTLGFMFESHFSKEVGYQAIMKEMSLQPMFYMNMRLGEGSGCPFTFFALDAVNSMMNNMYTFADGMINAEYGALGEQLKF